MLLCIVMVALGCPTARASGVMVGTPLSPCVLRASPDTTPRALFAHPGAFNCTAKQTKFGPGDYWVISRPLDSIDRFSDLSRVRIASMWQQEITLHALYPDGTIRSWPLDGQAMSRHIQMGAILEWQLPHQYGPPKRLLWHVKGAANLRGILKGAYIASRHQSDRANLEMGAMYAAFGGLCVALLVFNLALWTVLRHRFQLAYCALVLWLGAYALTSSGALAWLWPDIVNNDRIRLNYLLLAGGAITALYFSRVFFEQEITKGWVVDVTRAVSATLVLTTVAMVLLAPWQIGWLDTLYSLSFAAIVPLIAPIIWRARQLRSPYLWLFILAWSVPLLFACLRIGANLGLVPWNFWIDNSTILAMAFEAVMSTLAIAYRIRLLSRERDEARAHELAARLLADTDPLTGLLNRRAFLARAMKCSGEQTLMLADLDHFKMINETLGHDGGDEVLRVVARTLRSAVNSDGLVARIGGEEFAIVQSSATAINPDALLARLRAARMPFDLTVTASIGSCNGPLRDDEDWKRLYRCADRALYAAKSAGRDRVRRAAELSTAA